MSKVAVNICSAILSGDKAALASLLLYATKTDLKIETIHGDTFRAPLMAAAESAFVDAVQMLITAGADVDQKENESGWTALVFASREGHAAVAVVLLHAGASTNIKTHEGSTALMIAATWNHVATVAALLQAHADANCKDGAGNTALILAAENSHVEVVKLLLHAQAKVDTVNDAGVTALMLAAKEGFAPIVAELLRAGADSKVTAAKGETALMWASVRGHLSTVQELLAAHVDVNAADKTNATALILAAAAGHASTVEALRLAGADLHARGGPEGWTALQSAVHGGHTDTVEVLLRGDAESALQDSLLLLKACRDGQTAIVRLLLQAGADGSKFDALGNSPLVLASSRGHLDTVTLLVQHGVAIDASGAGVGTTALMAASQAGHLAVVQLLLETGADAQARNCAGLRAVDVAKTKEIRQLLENFTLPTLSTASSISAYSSSDLVAPWSDEWANAQAPQAGSLKPDSAKLTLDTAAVSAAAQESPTRLQLLSDGLGRLCISGASSSRLDSGTPAITPDTSPRGTPKRRPRPVSVRDSPCSTDSCEMTSSGSFHCGKSLITDMAALAQPGNATARMMYRGQFKSQDSAGAPTTTLCVIKCASTAGQTSPSAAEIAALRRESEMYQVLQRDAQGSQTGCARWLSTHPEGLYLVMEHHGGDLHALLAGSKYEPLQVLGGIVPAVLALHSLGFMHGDIRPENILCAFSVLGHCVVKLCNLYRARRVGEMCDGAETGAKQYLAPEVSSAAQSNSAVKASLAIDMFALGLVLTQVLRRSTQPVLESADAEMRRAWYEDEALRWSHLRVPAPYEQYDAVVQGLTRTDPLQRTDAHALWRQIKEVSGNATPK